MDHKFMSLRKLGVLFLGIVFSFGCGTNGVEFVAHEMGPEVAVPTEDPAIKELHPMLKDVIEAGPYDASWKSIVRHRAPKWFTKSKIGISAHWGPYAVPGWTPRKDSPYGVAYAEWYWVWMKNNKGVKKYHQDVYGGAGYDEFFDGVKNLKTGEMESFHTKDFDADEWMRLFKAAGAKYFFITSKHHDGFCIWDTKYTDRNSMKMGPKRDLYGEMVTAARKHGLKIGLYYSFYEWNNPIYHGKKITGKYKGLKKLADEDGDGNSNEFVDDFMIPQLKELVDKYQPDCMFFDGEWDHGYPYWRGRQFIAYYYNQAAMRGQEVLVNDRFGQKREGVSDTRGVYGDIWHVEYHANIDRDQKPWAMWRGFGNSYGYNKNEHPANILSFDQVIKMVVDVVSDNGNIEFNLGPKADGTIAKFEVDRLKVMGEWMKINSESIYDTVKSPVGKLKHGRVTHNPVTKTLYYHIYDWPMNGQIDLPGVSSTVTHAKLLIGDKAVGVTQTEDVISLNVGKVNPGKYVTVVALKYLGELKAEKFVAKVRGDGAGGYHLSAKAAKIGGKLKYETARKAVGYWLDLKDSISWAVELKEGGTYDVEIEYACLDSSAGGQYEFEIDGHAVSRKLVVPKTGGWGKFLKEKVAVIKFKKGSQRLTIRGLTKSGEALMNVRAVRLKKRD